MKKTRIKKIIVVLLCILLSPISTFAQERVPMTLEKSGIYTIPCEVNGLKLRFVFDTGASEVHLSLIEAAFMYKNGYITDDDFIGTGKYSMADGSVAENAIVNLKRIKIGSKTITNVTACVSSKIDASLLLGQSAIKKLGNYSIEGSTLVLNNSTTSNRVSTSTTSTSTSTRDSVMYDANGNIMPSNFTGKGKKVYSTGAVVECSFKNGLEYGFGKYTSKDGRFWYEGLFDHGEGNGKGKMYTNGILLEGTFKDSELDGQGKATWENGTIYTGTFANGLRTGKGKIVYENGNSYEGEFKNGKFYGQGTFKWKDGDKFVGSFVNGDREGYGTYTWANGEKYVGYSVKSKFEGKGTRYYNDGRKYEGEFSNSEMEGQGTFTWPGGDRYVGHFYSGYRSGKGTYYSTNKDRYEGDWKEGERTGKGIFYYADGRKYDGEFVKGVMTGTGTFTWPSGDKYIGSFKDGYRTGYGTYYWPSGDRHSGYWLKGKQDGEGTYYYASGGTKKGTWKDGEFVSSSGAYSSSSTTSSNNGYVDNSYNSTRNRNYSYDDDDDDDDTFNRNTTSGYISSQSTTYEDVDYYLAQVTTDLNLREGPGTDYDIVSRIPRGDYVFLSTADAGQSFRKVLYVDKNIFGYVSKNYLTNFRKVEEDASGNLQVESRNYKTTADIKIENRSNKTATIAIGSLTYTFSPYQTRTIKDIKPGKYKTMASSPGVIPYVGFDTVEGGYEYSWVFYIKTVTK